MLLQDQSACVSPDKLEPLCTDCKRNIDLQESINHTLFSEFTPYKVKKLGSNSIYKCHGYIKDK